MKQLKHLKQLRHLIPLATLALGVLTLNPAQAHGSAQPRHGGIVQSAQDLDFELVTQADGVTLYVFDHDKPLPTQGMSGKLTVLQGSQKTEFELKAAGDNKLSAGGVKLGKGDKVVAVLAKVQGKGATVRFTVR